MCRKDHGFERQESGMFSCRLKPARKRDPLISGEFFVTFEKDSDYFNSAARA